MDKKIIYLFFILVSLISFSQEKKEDFWKSSDKISRYSKDKIYPQGRIFPFSGYSSGGGGALPKEEINENLRELKEYGVTMIGPQYELNEDIITHAKMLGVKCIYSPTSEIKREEVTGEKKDAPTIDSLVEKVKENVKKVVNEECIAWWYITPEELRHWRPREMEYLKKVAEMIREIDPLKRPIWMYDPGHRTKEDLKHTAKYLDIVGKGMYTNYSGMKNQRIWCKWTIEQEKQAIEQINPKVIPIAVPEMFRDPDKEEIDLIPKWVRHDVYLSLVSGAKGIVIFSFRKRENFNTYDIYYKEYMKICKELCGDLKLGEIFLFGDWRDDIKIEILKGSPTIKMTFRGETQEYPSISFANISYENKRFLFLVNSSNEPLEIVVSGFPKDVKIKWEDLFNEKNKGEIKDGKMIIKLESLETKGLKIFKQ